MGKQNFWSSGNLEYKKKTFLNNRFHFSNGFRLGFPNPNPGGLIFGRRVDDWNPEDLGEATQICNSEVWKWCGPVECLSLIQVESIEQTNLTFLNLR